jgi:hypothetical protein
LLESSLGFIGLWALFMKARVEKEPKEPERRVGARIILVTEGFFRGFLHQGVERRAFRFSSNFRFTSSLQPRHLNLRIPSLSIA